MKFSEWFVAQHGKRPSKEPIYELTKISNALHASYLRAEELEKACRLYDEKMTSAHYAWRTVESFNKAAPKK